MADPDKPARPPATTRPVSRAPRPLTSLGGISPPPTPTIRVPRITYQYPEDFPEWARRRVFAEQMLAEQVLDEKKNSVRDQQDADALLLEFVLRVFDTFAVEACELGRHGLWSGERIDSECHDYLWYLAHCVHLTRGGEIGDDVYAMIKKSGEWKKYRRGLREVAEKITDRQREPHAAERVEAASLRGNAGRPRAAIPKEIYAAWIEMGEPEITAKVCDKLGIQFFGEELKGCGPGSTQNNRVRQRVRQTILRGRKSSAT